MLLVALAVSAAAAPAATDGTPPNPTLICRAGERQVGSRIRKGRTCKTAEQWAIEDARRDRKPADMRVTEGQSTPTGAPSGPR
ncbi:MAG TPA: hypothetical protein VJM15_08125 [Sphingomicrobium sp.]|nr:hypothetical protein [Sphingomicrobium sp.]